MTLKDSLAALIILLTACTDQVDISSDNTPELTFNILFTTQDSLCFQAYETAGISNNYYTPISTLQFDWLEDGILQDIIGFDNEMGIYSLQKQLVEGTNYQIRTVYMGEDVSAGTTIPSAIPIRDVNIESQAYRNSNDYPYNRVNLSWQDPAGANYYLVYITCKNFFRDSYWGGTDSTLTVWNRTKPHLRSDDPVILSESYFPRSLQDDDKTFPFLVFNDQFFEEEEYSLQLYYDCPIFIGGMGVFIYDHTPIVSLVSIHEDFYHYLVSYIQHNTNREGNILSGRLEPVNVEGNIRNAQGIFSAYSPVRDSSNFLEREDLDMTNFYN